MTNVLLLSSINGISSINWMTVWLMMELNTLAMCFIMTKDYNKMKAKKIDTLIYFLTQMMASSIIIILVSSQNMSSSNELLMMLCLITKMGTWPLHLWYIKILSCMELKMKSMLLMMTWQKVLPATMISLMEMSNTTKMITILLCLTSLITPLTKVKYMKPSMIMTLSSLNNNSWIIMASLISMETLLYLIMMYTMVLICSMKQLDNNPKSLNKTMITMMSYLSLFANLSGMPPFTMFWVKLMMMKKF
uniref:NADH-ubiquinone oxidoreductase chain 2 n=1 Tax=Histiostoma feroniarum TaxID=334618 RepID=A0A2Z4MAM5_9ACAR|nr:NADH dehydrogenase subunit 2 [Histiostoma feroniarum]AWX53529.1 NADH dehydrogenase subunit 2 [Histiostoma feroniarum]